MPELKHNVHVMDEETGEAKWYGPDYPENGQPPKGSVTNKAAYEEENVKAPPPEELTPREHLEGAADPTRAGIQGEGVEGDDDKEENRGRSKKSEGVEQRGIRGDRETGDRSRTTEVTGGTGTFPPSVREQQRAQPQQQPEGQSERPRRG